MHVMSLQMDERDENIEQLRFQLQHQTANYRQLFKQTMGNNKNTESSEQPLMPVMGGIAMDQDIIMDQRMQIDQIQKENVELRELVMELQKDIDYGKQRENKLIFFLYVLKEHGLPVSDVFDQEIKDLPTSRFSKDFNDDYKVLHNLIKKERADINLTPTDNRPSNGFLQAMPLSHSPNMMLNANHNMAVYEGQQLTPSE